MRLDQPLDDVFHGRNVRVLRALDGLPSGFSVSAREVARRAGVSHPTASSILASLAEQGLVLVRRTPSADLYELNRDHVLVERVTPVLEWERRLRDELLAFLRQQIRRRAPSVQAAFLFGSAARGDMTSASDIDVAIICPQKRAGDIEAEMEPVVEAVRRRFGNRLNVVVGHAPVEQLRQPRRRAHRLWDRIAEEGIPITEVPVEADRA